jgi:hypothetical protein
MWLKRKTKNRRLEREFLLDVKLRSQQLRAARLRFTGIAVSCLFAVLLTGFVLWRGGEWLLDKFLYQNEAFIIRNIHVQTDGVVATNHLARWAMIKPGQNLLALDLGKVKRDLELFPVIQTASVERLLPNTLRLRVTERVPVAQVPVAQLRQGGGVEQVAYNIDEFGFIFPPLDPRLRSKPVEAVEGVLPIISGADVREVRPGRSVESEQVKAALRLIVEFDHSEMFGFVELQRIDVSAPELLHVYTANGSEVFFSMASPEQQLSRWRIIHDHSQRWGKAIGSLDLSISNNVPLRLVEVTPNQTTQSKSLKTPRPRKKNV